MEPDEWDKWKLSKDYEWARTDTHVGNNYDYMAEIHKKITEHRLKSLTKKNSNSVSSNPKPKAKLKVDVTHMSKDVGADILQRVKQTYENHND